MKLGICDSGIGGLTILDALQKVCPYVDYVYLADTAWHPYGDRSASVIQTRSEDLIRTLALHVDHIVVACHTSSTLLTPTDNVTTMKEASIRAIMAEAQPGPLMVMATPLATHMGVLSQKLRYIYPDEIVPLACPGLASLIEENNASGICTFMENIYARCATEGIKNIFYGCTHYPLIEKYLTPPQFITTIDPAMSMAHYLHHTVMKYAKKKRNNTISLYMTGKKPQHSMYGTWTSWAI